MKKKLICFTMACLCMLGTMFSTPIYAQENGWVQTVEKNQIGVKENVWRYYENGNEVKGKWKYINGNWYSFRGDGIMRVGWYSESPTKRYYLTSSGAMKTGWLHIDNKWFYFDKDGSAHTGPFADQDGYTYFLRPYTNDMATDVMIRYWDKNEVIFGAYFDKDGKLQFGVTPELASYKGVYQEIYPTSLWT